jgi:hypothetical protein
MKITTQFENMEPFEGNRSIQYLGIALFMHRDFFHITRDTKFGKARPDPRIVMFNRKIQDNLRRRLMDAAESLEISSDEAESKWVEIVFKGTLKATSYVQSKTGAGRLKEEPLTIENHKEIVKGAFKDALVLVSGLVHERETLRETWNIQPSLNFGSDDLVWVYIRRDNPHTNVYKIGKTMRREKRNSTYATHSAESKEIAAYPESEHLTEKLIHDFFSAKRTHREFFRLTPDEVALVVDPKRMRAAISGRA